MPRQEGAAEDDGWVLSLVYDGNTGTTDLVVLDAARISAGPVATVHLKHHLPFGLHGSWSDQYRGPKPSSLP